MSLKMDCALARRVGTLLLACLMVVSLSACSTERTEADIEGTTSGPAFTQPSQVLLSPVSVSAAGGASIDLAAVDEGYAGAAATSTTRLKLQVSCGEMSYNYDMPADGDPIVVPMNMGDGLYDVRVLENTGGTSYAEIARKSVSVNLDSEFEPYLRPNLFCSYDEDSLCVAKARELAEGAANQGEVARAIYLWMVDAISYDKQKAEQLEGTSGYVPDPDATLQSGYGICFDYASLAAAMFRSLGIPCQIVTGNVAPEDVYHAWNLIYLDGSWVSALITIEADEWTRIDTTFAASEGDQYYENRDDASYTERYHY